MIDAYGEETEKSDILRGNEADDPEGPSASVAATSAPSPASLIPEDAHEEEMLNNTERLRPVDGPTEEKTSSSGAITSTTLIGSAAKFFWG